MKYLTERTEIAKALNFGKYPVIKLDVTDEKYQVELAGEMCGYHNIKVRIPHKDLLLNCQMRWFGDKKKITFGNDCTCISSRFSYDDLMEEVEYANAPIIDKDTEFVLVVYNSKTEKACVILLKTNDSKDINCQTILSVDEKIDLFTISYVLNS